MKRRWWIVKMDDRTEHSYVWCRDPLISDAPVQVVGCVCHHSWTQRVRSFVEVPDA